MNMIQNAKDQVLDLTVSAYQKAAAEGLLPQDAAVTCLLYTSDAADE